ncbi:hypothetical protein BKA70DRAFT_1369956 [Coprinopsis sp. MPI-PUGE-AT-0042]|nr:hypothetical protein BKA70DRAFT_1369956 [Coprinopsis sp. MPI-PUGE-AT-0042]
MALLQCNDLQRFNSSIDCPFTPQSEAFRSIPEADEAANLIVAAAFQLVATVLPPPSSMLTLISGYLQTAAMRVCLESNVTEILREAGPGYVYKELRPDVFTNTRLSSVLDTGESLEQILANAKHDDTDIPKSSVYLDEALSNPTNGDSDDVTHAAFNRAFDVDTPFWDWLEMPEQEHRPKRFGQAMRRVQAPQPADTIPSAYKWEALPKNSVVVDVAHDFFTEQPLEDASAFFWKAVLHDWSDSYCEKILKQLREAAEDRDIPGSTTKEAPEPLLANYGVSNGMAYISDLTGSVPARMLHRTLGSMVHTDR